MFTPESLTGALVREVRDAHKLSRNAFMKLAGLPGKSSARLSNIEGHDGWKPGDREKVAAALNQLVPNFDPRWHRTNITRPTPAAETNGDGPAIYLAYADEPLDPEETLATVVMENVEDAGDVIAIPTIELIEPEISADDVVTVYANAKLDAPPAVVEPLPETHVNGEVAIATRDDAAVDHALTTLESDARGDADDRYAISNSELQTWKRCRRKWWLAYYRGLALQTETFVGARSVGDRVHRALQRWYVPDGEPRVDPRDALERVIVEDWTAIAALARKRNTDEDQLTHLATEFGKATNLERAMVEGYVQWLGETGADADLQIVASETALEAPVTVDVGTGTRREEREAKFVGKLDVRARRVTDDVRLFIDHKTVGDLKGPAVTLPQNEQMLHYLLLEFLNTPEGETRCDGALYNMLKRSKRTARATPPFYERIEVRHNPYELASYRRRALAASALILEAVDRLNRGDLHLEVAFPSPTASCRWDCDFFAICNLFDDGSPGVEDMVNVLYERVDPNARYQETRGTEQ